MKKNLLVLLPQKQETFIAIIIVLLFTLLFYSKADTDLINVKNPRIIGINCGVASTNSNKMFNPLKAYGLPCTENADIWGSNYYCGISYLYLIEDSVLIGSTFNINLNFNQFDGSLKSIYLQETLKENYKLSVISIDGLYSYITPINITIGCGLNFGYIIKNNLIISNDDSDSSKIFTKYNKVIRYENNGKRAIFYDSPINNINHFMCSLKIEAGLIYKFNNFIITPIVGYNSSLTEIVSNSNWEISSIYFNFKLYYKF